MVPTYFITNFIKFNEKFIYSSSCVIITSWIQNNTEIITTMRVFYYFVMPVGTNRESFTYLTKKLFISTRPVDFKVAFKRIKP